MLKLTKAFISDYTLDGKFSNKGVDFPFFSIPGKSLRLHTLAVGRF